MVQEINTENFDKEVISHNGVIVVDFFANWCGPCRKLGPILEEVEQELSSKVKFAKINTDDNLEMAKKYQVSGLPTLMVFKDGEAVERMVGLMPKSSIITNIEKHV
ncbi:MAG: thioredoxin [Candidatus Gastranaerophilales bacterium]|nr:thioredoxin [Candidatus Gastranaerophilales bacterium]MCM1072923.1 thioredoxin [Bacteroides sp.]